MLATKEIGNRFDFICQLCKEEPNRLDRMTCVCAETQNLTCDWNRSDHLKCPKCVKIQFPIFSLQNIPFSDEWSYIYYHAVKKEGVEWYKKARDKLIKKIENWNKTKLKKDLEENNNIVKKINKW